MRYGDMITSLDCTRQRANKKRRCGAGARCACQCRQYRNQTVNDSPQPHVAFAFGLENTKPFPFNPVV